MRARTAAVQPNAARLGAALVALTALAVGLAPSAGADGYRVRPGETASEIARDHGTTVRALAEANGLADVDRIIAGQVLVIPGAAPATPATVVHVVAPGETLGGIARHYGTSSSAIASANGISNPNLVRIGQVLTIPAGGGGGSGGGGSTGSSANAATGGADGRTGVSGTHVVRSGETLAGVARRYGVDPMDLAAANGILPPHHLYADARLRLDGQNRLPGDLAACPLPGASYVNDWGFPRSGGRAHEGNDLFAPRGTPVRAPVSGTVSYATGSIGGRQFRLAGDDGTVYLGSHMDAFGPTGRVRAGDTIGYVGSSGNAAGSRPHLHFEVHPDGGPAMNPYPLMRDAC